MFRPAKIDSWSPTPLAETRSRSVVRGASIRTHPLFRSFWLLPKVSSATRSSRARDDLSTAPRTSTLGVVSLGTPHYSVAELGRVVDLLDGRRVHPSVGLYLNTGRDVLHEIALRGWAATLEAAGARIVTDTCTYITPVMAPFDGVAMTDSAKWAHYAPSNIGVDTVFGGVEDCVESAVAGRIVFDDRVWSDR